MKYVLLILASFTSLAAQAISPQANRPYTHAGSYRQWQQPNRGQIQTYGQTFVQPYYNPYYNPYYAPYEPDNGPMRGPNSIQGHQNRSYNP